jgi:hypothetical protein
VTNGSYGHFGDLRVEFLNDWFRRFFDQLTPDSSIWWRCKFRVLGSKLNLTDGNMMVDKKDLIQYKYGLRVDLLFRRTDMKSAMDRRKGDE